VEPYRPRRLTVAGVEKRAGWRIKKYAIQYNGGDLDWDAFAPALDMAWHTLPKPAVTDQRPGVGFLIAHNGRGADYLVLAWWDRENELPLRVFVRQNGEPAFRPARGSESVCVWDLRVIAAERGAYVATVLAAHGADVEGYLYRFCDGE
jgi:hypothetical protein